MSQNVGLLVVIVVFTMLAFGGLLGIRDKEIFVWSPGWTGRYQGKKAIYWSILHIFLGCFGLFGAQKFFDIPDPDNTMTIFGILIGLALAYSMHYSSVLKFKNRRKILIN